MIKYKLTPVTMGVTMGRVGDDAIVTDLSLFVPGSDDPGDDQVTIMRKSTH